MVAAVTSPEMEGVEGSKEKEVEKCSKDKWDNATTFFVSNIPAGVRSHDLRAVFSAYGTIVDAVVPFRPANSGSSFGFVRFQGK
ncbi:hypothetical protein SSX86_002674 [Deinandra increscens subsp. villosa]|uniref:RRM domain-containing protein n=1 Tax=Deinandra increscens subsp. villosa TaxID=3103831 RepID=A0AAP0DTW8_9ASTR